MLRPLILLACDHCTEMLAFAPTFNNHLGTDWTQQIHALECEAEENGWRVYHSQYMCDACVVSNMAQQNRCTDRDMHF